jgi:hypothetical protein
MRLCPYDSTLRSYGPVRSCRARITPPQVGIIVLHVALHQDSDDALTRRFCASTDSIDQPMDYPLCHVPGHHLDPTPPIVRVDSAFATNAGAVLHDVMH